MTNNVSRTTKTDNVPETTKRRPGRPKGALSTPEHYLAKNNYHNITIRLDARVHRMLKIMAAQEETPLLVLLNEAIVAWVKWLAKAEREDTADAEQRFREAADLLYILRQEREMKGRGLIMQVKRREKIEKALKSRRSWHWIYPGKPWPGEGKQPAWLKTYVAKQEKTPQI